MYGCFAEIDSVDSAVVGMEEIFSEGENLFLFVVDLKAVMNFCQSVIRRMPCFQDNEPRLSFRALYTFSSHPPMPAQLEKLKTQVYIYKHIASYLCSIQFTSSNCSN